MISSYEYKVVSIRDISKNNLNYLTEEDNEGLEKYGKEGWQLIWVINSYIIFIRRGRSRFYSQDELTDVVNNTIQNSRESAT